MENRINSTQTFFMIIIIFSITKFYALPATLSGISNEASYQALALNFIIDFLLLLSCVYIVKFQPKKCLYDSSISLFGKGLTNFIFIVYAIYFLIKAFIPILEQKNTISLTFYESQPTLLIFMPYFIVAFYIIVKGVNAFFRSVGLVFWLWLTAFIITLALSISSAKFSALLPIIQPKNKILKGTYTAFLWFGDPISILFFEKFLKDKKALFKKSVIAFITCALATLLLYIVFYSIFESISERQYYAPIKMSKYSLTLSNIGRLDYFGAILFSIVSVYAVTMPILLANVCVMQVFKLKKTYLSGAILVAIETILVFLFQNEIFENIKFIIDNIMPFLLVVCYALPLIMFLRILFMKKENLTLKGEVNV